MVALPRQRLAAPRRCTECPGELEPGRKCGRCRKCQAEALRRSKADSARRRRAIVSLAVVARRAQAHADRDRLAALQVARGQVRVCSRCHVEKALALFPRAAGEFMGRYYYCLDCNAARVRAYKAPLAESMAALWSRLADLLGGVYQAWCQHDERCLNFDLECLWWSNRYSGWGHE